MIGKPSLTAESWRRLTRWAGAACLALLTIGWASSALAACAGASFPCDWDFKRKLTFNNAGQLENLVNVPVLVVLNSSRIDYSQTQNAGQDLRFTDSDGTTLLAHEIEKWDEAGTSYVWVKVPQIDGSSTTDHIWMFYGNPTAPDGQNPTAVWSNGYVGVWHLKEATNTTRMDSTSNNNDVTDPTNVAAVTGKIGDATDFVPTDSLTITDAAQTGLDLGTQFTLEAWAKADTLGVNRGILTKESSSNMSYKIRLSDDQFTVMTSFNGTTANNLNQSGTSVAGTWYYVVGVYNSPNLDLYLNGSWNRNLATAGGSVFNGTAPFSIGVQGSSSQPFDGIIDEGRVSNIARSGDWIKAQYLSMTDAFITYGSQEAVTCPPPGPLAPCNWQRRRKLTFNNSAQAENLVNFPVLVVLNSSRVDYSLTQNQGQDLRFTDSDGVTLLAHEIEKWDETGTSYVWVKVPQIDASSNTDYIWMYYGNATAADGQDAGSVWSNGFVGVWHLKEDPSASQMKDSTCNAQHGTSGGAMTSANQVPGKIAGSLDFDAVDDYVDMPEVGDGWSAITVSAWIKADVIPADYLPLVARDKSGGTGVDDVFALMGKEGTGGGPAMRVYRAPGNTKATAESPTPLSTNTWYYLTGTYDGANVRIYTNGAQSDSTSATGVLSTGVSNVIVGDFSNPPTTDYNHNGIIDEVRISNVARSAAWVAAQYLSMMDVFITFGAAEVQGASVSYYSPDAAAAGMHLPLTFVGSFCAVPAVTTSSSDIVIGPSILTDATGAVVTQNGKALSTMFFIKPDARPKTGITVSIDGNALTQTLDIVIPAPDPNVTSGTSTLSGRTKRGTKVLGGLTVSGGTLTISKTDSDGATAGNQGYLPAVILVKGDVNIVGTLNVKGTDGTNGGSGCSGGTGGAGGPGGGGGGGGGVKDGTCSGGGSGAVNVRISTGTDDAEEKSSDGTMQLNDVELDMVDTGADPKTVGLRFQNITIPQGSTITNAYVEFTAEELKTGTTNLTFEGEAIDDAPTFTSANSNISTRTTTSASVAWNNVPSWSADVAYQTPNLSVIIQEIVGRPGWVSGNDLVIIVTGSAGDRDAWSYNHSSATAPLLHVDWGGGAGTPSSAAPGGAGRSGGAGGGSKGTGTGGAGGDGSNAAGSPASGTTGGGGGTALGGATGGGGGGADTGVAGGGGGGGGTGNPFGTGGAGAFTDNAAGGEGGGGGGAPGTTAGGGGGGGFVTAGGRGTAGADSGYGGSINGNAQLVPLMGGSGGAGGGPDADASTTNRGGGGGGGGGAILIYATGSVTVSGTITAAGGSGGNGSGGSGGGGGSSGGAILLQAGKVTTNSNLTTAAGAAGGSGSPAGGAGGTGRIRIDGLESGSVPGTAGSKLIGPVIDKLVGTNVTGRADGGATVTLYVYDQTGAQVSGSPYTASASGSSGTVGTWTISNVTFPSGTGYLAVKQSSGSYAVFGPGRPTKGLHLINWREVY